MEVHQWICRATVESTGQGMQASADREMKKATERGMQESTERGMQASADREMERKHDMARKTLLWPVHASSGAQFAEFAGWEMPIRYTDIQEEHRAVRNAAGLFDVSHMGELRLTGPGALAYADFLVTNKVSEPEKRKATYSPMCHADGGTVDDLFVYGFSQEEALLVVNAGNIRKDEAHIRSLLPEGIHLADESPEWLQLALQGPAAAGILDGLAACRDLEVPAMRFMSWKSTELGGYPAIISRSGYTGGDGFEIYVRCGADAEWATAFWHLLLQAGKPLGILPAGLGARDTLRLEGALPLYGHELRDDVTPIEAGLSRFVRMDKKDFSGKDALVKQLAVGGAGMLAGLVMKERGIAREGYRVFSARQEAEPASMPAEGNSGDMPVPESGQAEMIGTVTSGGVGIHVGHNIAMAFLKQPHALPGSQVLVEVRGRLLAAEVVRMPFYRK